MAFWDNWKDKVSGSGQSAVRKTKNMAELSRQNSHLQELEKQLEKQYADAGRHALELYGTTPEFAGAAETIAAIQNEIDVTKAQINELKGIVICPECGREVSVDDVYCKGCGHQMRQPAEPVPGMCPRCRRPVPEDAEFCPRCGMKIPKAAKAAPPKKLICPYCGQELLNDSLFCVRCGRHLPDELLAEFAEERAASGQDENMASAAQAETGQPAAQASAECSGPAQTAAEFTARTAASEQAAQTDKANAVPASEVEPEPQTGDPVPPSSAPEGDSPAVSVPESSDLGSGNS